KPRRCRPDRRTRRPRPCHHPRGRLLEVVHHAGDDGRRRCRNGVAAGGRRRRPLPAPRRRHGCATARRRPRLGPRPRVPPRRVGGWPLLAAVGGRAGPHGRHRPRGVPSDAGRDACRRQAPGRNARRRERAGATRPARRVAPLVPGCDKPRRGPVQPRAATPPRPSPAVDDGEPWQAGHGRRFPDRRADRTRGLGRQWHRRPACVLPVAAPGHRCRAGGPHRRGQVGGRPAGHAPRGADGQPPGPGRGPGVRPHRSGDRNPRRRSRPGRPPGVPRQPAIDRGPAPRVVAVDSRPTGGPLRAPNGRTGGGVGHQPVRPVGGRVRQGPGDPLRWPVGGRRRSTGAVVRSDPPLSEATRPGL
ncbi:uncharacterized protein METZ01_LOCUS216704, partial [marine metagenome]